MTEKTRENEMDALKAAIERLREEISALSAGVKKSAESGATEPQANGEPGPGKWADFQETLDDAWTQGEMIVKELSAAIERHPRVGSMAAFGLGFTIAKLWYRGSKP